MRAKLVRRVDEGLEVLTLCNDALKDRGEMVIFHLTVVNEYLLNDVCGVALLGYQKVF